MLGIVDDPQHRQTPTLVHPLEHGLLLSEESMAQQNFLQCLIQSGSRFDDQVEFIILDPFEEQVELLAEPTVIEVLSLRQPELLERFSPCLTAVCSSAGRLSFRCLSLLCSWGRFWNAGRTRHCFSG
ncbi:MAG: hypothetical protein ACLSA6_01585 [Holdemania massiliensis]